MPTEKQIDQLIVEIRVLGSKPKQPYKDLYMYIKEHYNEVAKEVAAEINDHFVVIENEDGSRDFAQKLNEEETQEFLHKFRYGVIPILAKITG